jgi:HAD superfamily hydrolase (TIGR01509 family)
MLQDAFFDRYWDEIVTGRADIREWLAAALLARAQYLMDTLDLSAHVDGCYYSAAIGQRKPASAFFEIVVSKVGLRPFELLLLDDAGANVERLSKLAGMPHDGQVGSG